MWAGVRGTKRGVAEILLTLVISMAGSWGIPGGSSATLAQADVTSEQVETAIQQGVRYLKRRQNSDGSWPGLQNETLSRAGWGGLALLALITAGEPIDDPVVAKGLDYLRSLSPEQINNTYAISLQTMVYAAADPARDKVRIAANVNWLEKAQYRTGDRNLWPGSWSYTIGKTSPGDGSNTQYALLGLNAAHEVGIQVDPQVWTRSQNYWKTSQRGNGGWTYRPTSPRETASMTCAGVSSLAITSTKRVLGDQALVGGKIVDCGPRRRGRDRNLLAGIDWLSNNFSININRGEGKLWHYYYLYGLERAGRLSGIRFFGRNDWYRQGAEYLVGTQDQVAGSWRGAMLENDPIVTTSFALLFLAKGRAPVLMHKMVHGPGDDWTTRRDDVRNLTATVSRDWQTLLTWQVADPAVNDVEDLLLAPIGFLNGSQAPVLTERAVKQLRTYVEQGGFLLAEATGGSDEFDQGFRTLVRRIFPEDDYQLRKLPDNHPVWRARHNLPPEIHPLYGIEIGCRTALIYTDEDLSCYWNLAETYPGQPEVVKALRVGQNIVDYATGREIPGDKLESREVIELDLNEASKRGVLRIAKLEHAGDWNVAPLAIPNLMTTLRETRGFDVVINHKQIKADDPNLIFYPLLYMHGRASLSFSEEDLEALRQHVGPGGGTLFADAACGSPAFDSSFRKFAVQLYPDRPLEPIPADDPLLSAETGYDLSAIRYGKALGGNVGSPQLEGIQIDGRWAVIYSKYDLGCALERQQGLDCRGYTYDAALQICTNLVLYATLPN